MTEGREGGGASLSRLLRSFVSLWFILSARKVIMPKASWYWNRLRAMSTAEVGHRLRHAAQTRVDRARLSRERLPGFELPEPLDPVDVPFFFDPARAEAMRAIWQRDYPQELSRLQAEADGLLA